MYKVNFTLTLPISPTTVEGPQRPFLARLAQDIAHDGFLLNVPS
jgi:hypothetical protein